MPHEKAARAGESLRTAWLKYVIIALILEKTIQHVVVTLAFYFNLKGIGSTVAVSPSLLMILGAMVAVLFGFSLWGTATQKRWAIGLVVVLALFDIVGEFVAQGRIDIVITVSFVVATILLVLTLIYRRQEARRARP